MRARRTRTWARVALAAALAAGTVAVGTATAPPASAEEGCATRTNGETVFTASVPAADRAAVRGFEDQIRATGHLYLCSDFATPPASIPATAGTVLRVRPIYPAPTTTSFAMRVMYVTTTRSGTPEAATTVVVVPRAAAPSGGRQSVLFAHGTAGMNNKCQEVLNMGLMALAPIYRRYLDAGKVFVMPDYIGFSTPGRYHPYFARVTTARTIIDAMRAVKNLSAVTDAGPQWGIFGHSQGGHAAVATAELFPTYGAGSGLDLVGAVSLAGGGQLWGTLQTILASGSGGERFFVASALYGMKADDPSFDPRLYLTPHAWYASETYLRNGNPVFDLNPWVPSMGNAGDPHRVDFVWGVGFVEDPAGPDLASGFTTVGAEHQFTPFASLLDLWMVDQGLGPIGTYGPFSVPRPERDIRSCTYPMTTDVFSRLPGNDFLRPPAQLAANGWETRAPSAPNRPSVKELAEENSVGTVGTSVPIAVVQGQDDPLNPPGTQPGGYHAAALALCDAGDNVILADQYPSDHSEIVPDSADDVEAWFALRFAGVPQTSDCP